MRPPFSCCAIEESSTEEFIGAVIGPHEQIRSNLSALRHGAAGSLVLGPSADDRTITIYCVHHGVETAPPPALRRLQHRWLAG